MITMNRKQLGNDGEHTIVTLLKNQGFTILARNYIVKGGEIDIIATNTQTVVFVEVKTRQHDYFDSGQVITSNKQRKIIHTAKTYLAAYPDLLNKICRFDVALIEQTDQKHMVTYIPNAFVEEL